MTKATLELWFATATGCRGGDGLTIQLTSQRAVGDAGTFTDDARWIRRSRAEPPRLAVMPALPLESPDLD